jgi:hypothetical protein
MQIPGRQLSMTHGPFSSSRSGGPFASRFIQEVFGTHPDERIEFVVTIFLAIRSYAAV